jgi:hypothetical protein
MRIVAWAIAIEKYDGDKLNISQPVGNWAAQFIQSANRHGVERIVFSASLKQGTGLASLPAGIAAEKAMCTEATQAGIKGALQYLEGFDVLLLYWVGHGIMAPARQLLCSDSKDMSNLASIVTDSLLKRLRGKTFPKLQIGFFECCAQTIAANVAFLNLGGDDSGKPDQFFYYAASQGEIASASTSKEGFSATVLKLLDSVQSWPPEPRPLFASIQSQLEKLGHGTRPFQLERTDGSGDVWSTLFAGDRENGELRGLAKSAGYTLPQFLRLWTHAQHCSISAEELATAISKKNEQSLLEKLRTKKPHSPHPGLLGDAFEQVGYESRFEPLCMELRLPWSEWTGLFRRVASDEMLNPNETWDDLASLLLGVLDQVRPEKGLRDFAKLLELAARRTTLPRARAELRAALNENLLDSYQAALTRLGPDSVWLYLQLDVALSAETQKPKLIQAWLYPGVDKCSQQLLLYGGDCLAEEINRIVQRVLAEYPESRLAIELFLPTELLSISKEMLLVNDQDLGLSTWIEEECPVVVRWKNRMQDRDNKYRGTWIARSRETIDRASAAQEFVCSWVPAVGQPGDFHVLALAFPGPSLIDPERNRTEFYKELVKGEPYMCWPRTDFVDEATRQAFRSAADHFFRRGAMPNLLRYLPEDRCHAGLENAVLLVDIPERNPYPGESGLFDIKQRGDV